MSDHEAAADTMSVWPAQPLVTPWDGMRLSPPQQVTTDYPSAATTAWTSVPAPRPAAEPAEETATSSL
jgi:hypothetical protein